MSDTYYREKADRRNRQILMISISVAAVACVAFLIFNLFRDDCTGSFDRSPEAVVTSFIEAVQRDEVETAIRCWEHNVYYEIEAGCSEVCLNRLYGLQFNLVDLELNEPNQTNEGRANLLASLTVTCGGGEEQLTGEILLDSVGSNLPWKHWKIIRSTFGGTVAEPWCQ